MKALFWVMLTLLLVMGIFYARPSRAQGYFPPYVYSGVAAVPYAYGYYSLTGWPSGIPTYGFTFVPYFAVPRFATYGVVAYSSSADTGATAWGYDDLDSASSNAIQNCGQADCRVVVWVQGGCAAISTSLANGAMGWAYADRYTGAKYNARKACRASGGGTACIHRGWVCSF